MSKYFDKLLKIDESLTKELKDKGLYKEEENKEEDMVPVPADSLTDDQKKSILSDTVKDAGLDIDDKTLDDISNNPEQLAGVQKILDAQKNESGMVEPDAGEDDESNELVYVRMDDDDLDMHGFLKSVDGLDKRELEWTDDEKEAMEFTRAEAASKIAEICDKLHYDYNTFNIQDVESQVDDNGENWVSIDSSKPSATVIP